jgi:dolichol-phosphate mannosyltransferase
VNGIRETVDPLLSLVIPCYNEQEVLPILQQRLEEALARLGVSWEVILVDDGSRDRTLELLAAAHQREPRFKVIGLSRNFGHQAAVLAGLRYAAGSAIAILDADLQDPPDLLGDCLERWRQGYQVVFGVRRSRKESVLRRAGYSAFYRLLRLVAEVDLPPDSGDFCLIDRRVADVLLRMPERNIFVRGMRAWAGFRQIGIPYERPARSAGRTKYSFVRLLRLAFDGIFAFSAAPLRLATWLGLFVVGLCFLGAAFVVVWRIFGFTFMGSTYRDIPGWAAGVVSVLFLGGVQLLLLGVLGEYLARIYGEVKQRPRWVVSTTLGVSRRSDQVE